jgi:hypothetical protein
MMVSSTQCLLLLYLYHVGFKWWLFLGGKKKKRDKQTNEHAVLSIGLCSRVSTKDRIQLRNLDEQRATRGLWWNLS